MTATHFIDEVSVAATDLLPVNRDGLPSTVQQYCICMYMYLCDNHIRVETTGSRILISQRPSRDAGVLLCVDLSHGGSFRFQPPGRLDQCVVCLAEGEAGQGRGFLRIREERRGRDANHPMLCCQLATVSPVVGLNKRIRSCCCCCCCRGVHLGSLLLLLPLLHQFGIVRQSRHEKDAPIRADWLHTGRAQSLLQNLSLARELRSQPLIVGRIALIRLLSASNGGTQRLLDRRGGAKLNARKQSLDWVNELFGSYHPPHLPTRH
mmetsp:Transcript_9732/g.16296  ORF Transcript_9732/g.16296 Transcript_9732/m.16296 type:complete len:264 (-) Transcript_9732:786-1577(-)